MPDLIKRDYTTTLLLFLIYIIGRLIINTTVVLVGVNAGDFWKIYVR